MKAKELASYLTAEILGDPDRQIRKPGYLPTAKPDELVYCQLKNDEKDLEAIRKTNAGIVICQKHLRNKLERIKVKSTLILSEAPEYDFAGILQEFFVDEVPTISQYSHIGTNVKMGKRVDIHQGAVIYDDTTIGNGVTIRANAVLGTEGLEYGKNQKGELKRMPHLDHLVIDDDVDIGSNTTVQKGVLRPTIIGKGTRIGPNCTIGHEVKIGRHCLITGMTMIAGSAEIGDFTYIAPHSTIRNSIKIGSNAFVGIGSLVMHDVPDGTTVIGRPAIEMKNFRKQRKRLKELLEL